ncbi:diacylglycerol/lipid kinase family protein [Chloroflexota bacterium]
MNPAAGANSTRKKWPDISRLLKHLGLSFDHQYTEGVGHAIELAKSASAGGYNYLVAVGGDGTVNEVANGILDSADAGSMVLGIISTGTGSDFARSAGIPRQYPGACSSLTGKNRLQIDVGLVEYRSNGKSMRRFFVNAAGTGFDAAAVETTERLPRYFGGTIPYLTGLLLTLIGYRNKPVTLGVGDKTEQRRILSVTVSNGNFFGGGMHIAPRASLTDRFLDLVVIGDIGKFDLLKSLPMVYKGTHGNHPRVTMEKVTEVTIESPERVLVQADGEVVGEGPATFRLIPAALNIVV